MSEHVTRILPVSSRTLLHAMTRLNAEKHPEKLAAITDEWMRRKPVERESRRRAQERKAA